MENHEIEIDVWCCGERYTGTKAACARYAHTLDLTPGHAVEVCRGDCRGSERVLLLTVASEIPREEPDSVNAAWTHLDNIRRVAGAAPSVYAELARQIAADFKEEAFAAILQAWSARWESSAQKAQ